MGIALKIWSYKEARDKIKLDMDLTEEDFVTENEFIGYFNAAIDEAEAEIHTLHEDYFLTKTTIAMVSGTQDYALPSNIYAQKIRGIIYQNGSIIYPVIRVRGTQQFFDISMTEQYGKQEDYRYIIRNDGLTYGYQISLIPPARETGNYMTLWYLRNATRIPLVGEAKEGGGTYVLADAEATKIECPEFINFIMALVRAYCGAKENGGEFSDSDTQMVEQQRKMMVDTLSKMIEDDDNRVVQDLSHYYEHS